eukprot:Nk52_evm4s230 gene=Nk52_evmTU4s230
MNGNIGREIWQLNSECDARGNVNGPLLVGRGNLCYDKNFERVFEIAYENVIQSEDREQENVADHFYDDPFDTDEERAQGHCTEGLIKRENRQCTTKILSFFIMKRLSRGMLNRLNTWLTFLQSMEQH